MADVDNYILKKITYAIYGFIPYADLDVLGALHYVGIDLSFLPEVKPIKIGNLSTFQKLLMVPLIVVPYFDLEWFKFFGFDPIRGGYDEDEELSIDKAEWDKTAGENSQMNSRNDIRPQGPADRGGGKALEAGGKIIKLAAFAVIPILLIFIAMSAVGGTGYGSLVEGAVGNQLAGVDFESGFTMVEQGVQTLQCFGNAACMRQWRFNNTQRPGSEEVGQSYSLQVDEFSVNDGNDLDIAGRRASYSIPVGFSLYNPRHGLKGIPARGTEYRIRIEDLYSQDEGAYCGTGWESIGGEYASDIDTEAGTITPGGFATPVSSLNELNLSSCGLLQPGVGMTRRVALDVKYNYSSQATLYFESMSGENMRSQGERPDFKASETADTPVKSYVNVESPVTFRQEDGRRASRVFRARLGMNTDRSDINYRYHTDAFRLFDSEKTVDVETARERMQNPSEYPAYQDLDISQSATCDGLEKVEGKDDTYTLSDSAVERAERMYNRSEWFSQDSGMSPVSCTMILDPSELSSISPSGETLTMRIDANYTVRIEKSNSGFRTLNSRCGGQDYNCPLIVPESQASEDGDIYSECTTENSPDAANGCDVRRGEDWHIIGEKLNKDSVDAEIEQGETAYLWSEKKDELGSGNNEFWKKDSPDQEIGAFGITEEEMSNLQNPGYTLFVDNADGNDVSVAEVEDIFCRETGSISDYKEWYLQNNQYEDLLYFNPVAVSCAGDIKQELKSTIENPNFWNPMATYIDWLQTGLKADRYSEALKDCDGVLLLRENSGFSCINPA